MFSSRTMISASISSSSSRFARVGDDRDLFQVEVVLIHGEPPGEVALLEGQAVQPRGDHRLDGRRDQRLAVLRAAPSRSSMPVDSTMKNGLPPARPTIGRGCVVAEPAPPACRASSAASSRAEARGARRPGSWRRFPSAGRSSSSSVRAATSTNTRPGPCRPRAAIRSIRSSICGRSVCASSNSSVTGRWLASPSSSARNPERTSWTNADSSRRGPDSPTSACRRSIVRASVARHADPADQLAQPLGGDVGRVVVLDAGDLAHHRGRRRERGAVRAEMAPPDEDGALRVEPGEELGCEPRLPDARLARRS